MKEINIKSKIEVSLIDGSYEEGRVVNFSEEGINMFDGKEGWLVKFEDIKKVVSLELELDHSHGKRNFSII